MNIEELYDTHVQKVYKFFYIKSLNQKISEDLTSKTFLTFIERSKAADIAKPKEYLYGIMRITWIEHLREKYESLASDIESIEDFEGHTEQVIEDYDALDLTDRLKVIVDKLPVSQRIVVELRHFQNASPKEIAEYLGKDKNYVKVTYRRALANLRLLLTRPELDYRKEP
jgi:RNA polymerase sigma factor (sigma-70 family)